MEQKKYKFFKAGMISMIATVLVSLVIIFEFGFVEPIEHNIANEQMEVKRQIMQITGDPAAGQSGLFYIEIVPHAANPNVTFANNYTGDYYEIATSGNSAFANTTPKATQFDILMKVGINASDGNNGTAWVEGYFWALMNITFTGGSTISNYNMTEKQIATAGNTYAYYYYWANGAHDEGYNVSENQDFNVTSLRLYGTRVQ